MSPSEPKAPSAICWLACFIILFFTFYSTGHTIVNGISYNYSQTGISAAFSSAWKLNIPESSNLNPSAFSFYSPALTIAFILFVLSLPLEGIGYKFETDEKNPLAFIILSCCFKVVASLLYFTFQFYSGCEYQGYSIGITTACGVFFIILFFSAIGTAIWAAVAYLKKRI